MSNKFTKLDILPKKYHTSNGNEATVYAIAEDGTYLGLMGVHPERWYSDGRNYRFAKNDLIDIPEKVTIKSSYGPFGSLGRHVITCNADGTDPTVTWEAY
jgi:hypothetical protein